MKQLTTIAILLPFLFSCTTKLTSEDVPAKTDTGEYSRVTMIVPPLSIDEDGPETKISLNLETLEFLWAEKDSVGIFPETGSQIYFSMSDGMGESVATFDGGGWALKKNSSYYSYFPFVSDFYIDKKAIPISFIGQEQDGNCNFSSANLNKYCFMVAKGVADETTGDLMFTYKHLQIPFMFIIPVEAGVYTSLDICAGSDVIAVSGTMDAISLDTSIEDPVFDDHLNVSLQNMTFSEASTMIVIATLPPFDIYGKQLTLNLTKSDGTIVTSSVFGKTYTLGKAYRNSPNFTVSASTAEISGDGGEFYIQITAAGSSSYSVSSDVDWLTINESPTSGSATITVTADKGTNTVRKGNVIISESVTYKETTINLQNKVEITQDLVGMAIGLGGWEKSDEDYGGSAR